MSLGPPLRRVLDRLAREDESLPLPLLAQRLLALREAPEPPLARRLLASALGCTGERLPDALRVGALPRLVEGPVAEAPLEEVKWVVVDLETTGLSPERSAILEIGAVRIEALAVADRFQTLVDPGLPIPPRITALTGIDRSMVERAPALAPALHAFRDWVGGGSGIAFVAHHAAFDAGFLRRAFEAHGLPPWPGPCLCTRRLSRRLLPDLPRYDLDSLSARFGIANRWRHRALGDAEAAARALLELVAIARAEGVLRTLGDLLELEARAASARTARRRRARGHRPPASRTSAPGGKVSPG